MKKQYHNVHSIITQLSTVLEMTEETWEKCRVYRYFAWKIFLQRDATCKLMYFLIYLHKLFSRRSYGIKDTSKMWISIREKVELSLGERGISLSNYYSTMMTSNHSGSLWQGANYCRPKIILVLSVCS